MGVCDSVDPGPRLALLARILGEKQVPKVGTLTVARAWPRVRCPISRKDALKRNVIL